MKTKTNLAAISYLWSGIDFSLGEMLLRVAAVEMGSMEAAG
jgi:hypothetical protein